MSKREIRSRSLRSNGFAYRATAAAQAVVATIATATARACGRRRAGISPATHGSSDVIGSATAADVQSRTIATYPITIVAIATEVAMAGPAR